jgi:hypothetical protein
VESYLYKLDTLNISQRDSSKVVFEMSPDLKTSDPAALETRETKSPGTRTSEISRGTMMAPAAVREGWETMTVQFCYCQS